MLRAPSPAAAPPAADRGCSCSFSATAPTGPAACRRLSWQVIPASCLRGSGLLLTPEFRDAVVPETGTYTLQVRCWRVLDTQHWKAAVVQICHPL